MSDAFGPDTSPAYNTIAAQVRSLKPSALPSTQYQDVVDILEFMRDECLKRHDANMAKALELAAQMASIEQREKDLALRQRAVTAAAGLTDRSPKRNFWR